MVKGKRIVTSDWKKAQTQWKRMLIKDRNWKMIWWGEQRWIRWKRREKVRTSCDWTTHWFFVNLVSQDQVLYNWLGELSFAGFIKICVGMFGLVHLLLYISNTLLDFFNFVDLVW